MDRRLSLAVPSQTKAKAIEEARKTQAAVLRDCAAAHRDPPPYVLSELIGKGSFGRVFKATTTAPTASVLEQTQRPATVAVKIISIEEGDVAATDAGASSTINAIPPTASLRGPSPPALPAEHSSAAAVDTFGDILKEIRTLQLLGASGARNINTVIDSLLVGPTVWMVTEYCAGGSVATLMRPTGHLPEKWIVPILREVAEALFWVHGQGIIHRDIKCANVLVAESGPGPSGARSVHSVQLCDFGVAGIVETAVDKRRTVTGTLHWMAPELFHADVAYGTEVDIWAFGSMAYEVASGLPPNATMAAIDMSTFGSYLGYNAPRLVGDQYSDELKELVALCMVNDPQRRLAIEQVQQHRYISGTANTHPTTSLSTLLSAYRLWQARGGGRLSLFSAGGARGTEEVDPGLRLPDWDFNDSDDDVGGDDKDSVDSFSLDYEANTLAVYEAYGISLDDNPPSPAAPPPLPPQSPRRRRQPPPSQKIAVPLEGVFNPDTLTSYRDKARAAYGRHPPTLSPPPASFPPVSDLPLRGYTKQPDRESLIDLDLSIVVQDTGAQPDEEQTMKPRHMPVPSAGYSEAMKHRTQDWTFPSAAKSPRNNAPAAGLGQASWEAHRASAISLIDLDDAGDGDAGSDNEDAPFEFDTGTDGRPHGAQANSELQPLPPFLPTMPVPPARQVLLGMATRDDTRNELLRMLSSLGDHLHTATHVLEGLPVQAMQKR